MFYFAVLVFLFAKEALQRYYDKVEEEEVVAFDIYSEVADAIVDWRNSRGPLSPSCDRFITSC